MACSPGTPTPRAKGQALALHPDGTVLDASPAALPMVASAAAATAAGDEAAAGKLLQRARTQQLTKPTYYGVAWDALGQALLSAKTLSTC
jgi:endoglucanase